MVKLKDKLGTCTVLHLNFQVMISIALWLHSGTKFIYLVKNHGRKILLKGQMKSECIYEIIDFPKYHRKI